MTKTRWHELVDTTSPAEQERWLTIAA